MTGIEGIDGNERKYRLFDSRSLVSLEWHTYSMKGSFECEYF